MQEAQEVTSMCKRPKQKTLAGTISHKFPNVMCSMSDSDKWTHGVYSIPEEQDKQCK